MHSLNGRRPQQYTKNDTIQYLNNHLQLMHFPQSKRQKACCACTEYPKTCILIWAQSSQPDGFGFEVWFWQQSGCWVTTCGTSALLKKVQATSKGGSRTEKEGLRDSCSCSIATWWWLTAQSASSIAVMRCRLERMHKITVVQWLAMSLCIVSCSVEVWRRMVQIVTCSCCELWKC